MKKILLAIPLIAGASWAGASYYTGTQTQSAYDKLLSQLNENKTLKLVNEQYSAGFTRSTAITNVMDSAAEDAKVLFRLHHNIEHSPITMDDAGVRVRAATIETTLLRDEKISEMAEKVLSGFGDNEPVLISTEVRLDGTSTSRFQVAEYQLTNDKVTLDFDGLDYTLDVDGSSYIGRGEIGELTAVDDEVDLHVSPAQMNVDMDLIRSGVFTGNYDITFEQLTIKSAENLDIQLDNVGAKFEAGLKADTIDHRVEFFAEKINAPIPLTSASFEYGLTNMSIGAVETFVDEMSKISQLALEEEHSPEEIKQMISLLAGLAEPGAGVDFKFNLENEGGKAGISYGVKVVDESSAFYPVNGITSAETVRDLIGALNIDYSLSADVAAIEQTPFAAMMMSPQSQQYVVTDGQSYKMDVSVADLIVYINGNPVSLELMFPQELGLPLSSILEL